MRISAGPNLVLATFDGTALDGACIDTLAIAFTSA
jgi:hypothetical protein